MDGPQTPTRLFDVECECGGEFRVALEVGSATSPPSGFLAPPCGQCPHCGLDLAAIEPFGFLRRNE
jgi:hypothetical protein